MPFDAGIKKSVTGVILAGGRALRMGGRDKGLIELGGKPLVEYVITGLQPQVAEIIINANRNRKRYATYGYPIIADMIDGYFGPLAGIASAMRAAKTPYISTAPCDSPFIPSDLVERLYRGIKEKGAEIGVPHNGERLQPVFALLDRNLLSSVVAYLERGERKIDRWYEQHRLAVVDFSDQPDTFVNVNTPEEAEAIECKLMHTRQS
ncbi:MAG: molybdenum cofactor guanylyltransferase [Gammaproteobacteria bacterium]|nr:molybdenum cofactor guanylyltransferase [Gammaproteobacteria bacterium]MCI0590060.1 molybdenum cofactor guanylyltransferase [Gammaproteobacteria bacterium]